MLICKNDVTRQSTMAKKTRTNQCKYMQITDLQTNLSKHETSQAQQNKLDNKVNQIKLNKVYINVSLQAKKKEPAMNLACVNKQGSGIPNLQNNKACKFDQRDQKKQLSTARKHCKK